MATVRNINPATAPGTRRYDQHVVYALAQSIRERDSITYEHCRRVAVYANRLARGLGWSRRSGRDLALAGLVHDLGKTWIQNTILHKESALSQDERHEMERHPSIAARILVAYGASDLIVSSVLHHHEAYDGRGYPDHLAGERIPIGARLLTIADVFDALTSPRRYKGPMPTQAVCERIAAGSGAHFDPTIAAVFLDLVAAQPDFVIPAAAAFPPVMQAPNPTWVRHDSFDEL